MLLAKEYDNLKLMDVLDPHVLKASWINNRTYEEELAIYRAGLTTYRQIGKHSGHANDNGVGKKRLVELIYHHSNGEIVISEWKAGKILDTINQYMPGIRGTFHREIQEVLSNNDRTLVNPFGARRTFFDKLGDEMFRMAYAYIKQSTVTGLTQRAALEIFNNHKWIRILVEMHDALLFEVPVWRLQEGIKIIKSAFERPIDFSRCSLPREVLTIP